MEKSRLRKVEEVALYQIHDQYNFVSVLRNKTGTHLVALNCLKTTIPKSSGFKLRVCLTQVLGGEDLTLGELTPVDSTSTCVFYMCGILE